MDKDEKETRRLHLTRLVVRGDIQIVYVSI